MTRYWLTTHWPPYKGEAEYPVKDVYLPDGREAAGALLDKDDIVLIYQAKKGPTEVKYLPDGSMNKKVARVGKEGIVSITKATGPVTKDPDVETSVYVGRKPVRWCWSAETDIITTNGFVSRAKVNEILEYLADNQLRGFGDLRSGLKEITEEQFSQFLAEFMSNAPPPLTGLRGKFPGESKNGHPGGESDDHRLLKEYVTNNPEAALGETGLKTIQMEYPFPTGDRADILLEDIYGRVVAVEIEVDVDKGQIEGLLQALKYRVMAELTRNMKPGEGRSVLVAYTLNPSIKKLCNRYKIEYHEIDRETVV